MNMTRKAFLGLGATAVCGVALGGAAKAFAGEGDLLRPPIVTDETEFTSKCLRCYRCISACPTGVLKPATVNDGFLNAKTPVMDFHLGACDFCNKCIEVCPTEAITPSDPNDVSKGRIGVAVVQEDRCLAFSSGCQECEKACPYGAITLDGNGHPRVDDSVCNGCGECEYICPALVYRSFAGGNRRGIVIEKG